MNTAIYLNRSMIKPSRASLLANFINSHPPSYYRIAAILGDELKPVKEAVLPLICLKKSQQKKFAKKFEEARKNFKIIANQKFKESFKITDVSSLMTQLKRKEIYKFDIQKDFLFKNLISDEIIIGRLENVQFFDDVADSDKFIIKNLKTNQIQTLDSILYSRKQYNLGDTYLLKGKDSLTLDKVKLNDGNIDGNYIFFDQNNKKVQKPISKTKLPISVSLIKELKNMDLFLKSKGELKIVKCIDVIPSAKLDDFQIEILSFDNSNKKSIKFPLYDLIIRPKKIYLNLSRSSSFRDSEIKVIKWLSERKILTYIYLKKPVNNLEIGLIQEINLNAENLEKNSIKNNKRKKETNVNILNIFGKAIEIPYKEIETLSFEYNSALIQLKSNTSFTSRIGYKLLKRFKPESIIIT
jgi:hypothetical protein